MTGHLPRPFRAVLAAGVVLLAVVGTSSAAFASTATAAPVVAASGGQPITSIPLTGPIEYGSTTLSMAGVTDWLLVSCDPVTSRAAYDLNSPDSSTAVDSAHQPGNGFLPLNVQWGMAGSTDYPMEVLGMAADGTTVVARSGCFSDSAPQIAEDGTQPFTGAGVSTSTVLNEWGDEDLTAPLGGLTWQAIPPGASSTPDPSPSLAQLNAQATAWTQQQDSSSSTTPTGPVGGTSSSHHASSSTGSSSTAPSAAVRSSSTHHHGSKTGFVVLLLITLILTGWGLARARAKHRHWLADRQIALPGGVHPLAAAGFHITSEIAPALAVLAGIGAGIEGRSIPDGVVLAFVGLLVGWSAVERATYASIVRPGLSSVLHAARRKPIWLLGPVGLVVVGLVAGWAGAAFFLAGAAVVIMFVPGIRREIAEQIAWAQAVADHLSPLVGMSADQLLELPPSQFAVSADGIVLAPLPGSGHARLLDGDAAQLVARSLPDWMIDPTRPPSPNGLYLVPVTEQERQRRETLARHGGMSTLGDTPSVWDTLQSRPVGDAGANIPSEPAAPPARSFDEIEF